MAKRIALHLIKKNQSYTVSELADVTRASEPMVRRWIGDGMTVIDSKRPMLILGFVALDYLGSRQTKAKQPMQLNQVFCLRCKAPRTPLGLMADYIPQSTSGGRLVALCEVCGCVCNRNISAIQLPEFEKVLDIKRGIK